MNNEAIKSMMNPIRMRIIQEISLKRTATTKEIAEICGDIPQASLYRHLNTLLKNGILEVVSENKVRGILEKVYAIKVNPSEEINKRVSDLTKEELSALFSQFIISLLSDFDQYLSAEEKIDVVKDMIGFRSYALYLSDAEFIEMTGEINNIIIKRIDNKASNDRSIRKFSTVITSFKKERIEGND